MKPDRTVPPEAAEISSFSLPLAQCSALSNGDRLYYYNDPRLEVIKIDLYYEAGKWQEEVNGASLFVTGLFKEGTKHHTGAEINMMLESCGAFLQSTPSTDTLTISIYSLVNKLERVLSIVAEIFDDALFPGEEVEKFRNVQLSQLSINEEKTSYLASREFQAHLFGPMHPYGKYFGAADLRSITREDILGHWNKFIQGSPKIVMASGYVGDQELRLIDRFLGMIPTYDKEESRGMGIVEGKGAFVTDMDKAVQSTIYLGKVFPGRRHPDMHRISLVNEILGGYFGSRLMRNLREDKGYTYGIYSRVVHMARASYLSISADVIRESRDDAVSEVRKEMQRMVDERVGEDELELVKNYMLGSLLSSITSPFSIMQFNRVLVFHDLPADFFETRMDVIRQMSAQEVQDTALRYFVSDDLLEVVVG